MLQCKMFSLFSTGNIHGEKEVNDWLQQLASDGHNVVFVTQSSAPGSALGMGEGVRTVLTIFYR